MKRNFIEKVKKTILFQNLSEEELNDIFSKMTHRIKSYEKGETLFMEEDSCDSIGIVLAGEIELYKGIHSGKRITLTKIKEGDMFAEAIIFSSSKVYPATIEALEKTSILYISRNSLMGMYLMYPSLIEIFIGILSNKILILNDRINLFSLKNIRQKIVHMLLKEGIESREGKRVFHMSKQKFSERIGVERPSLSRELIKMKEEGLIEIDGRKIIVAHPEQLMQVLQI